MQAEGAIPTSRRGEELSYVTEHFSDLRGLVGAPMFVALLVVISLAASMPTQLPRTITWPLAWGSVGVFVVAAVASEAFSRWYKRRFGIVENGAWSGTAPKAKRLIVMSRVILAIVMVIAWRLAHGQTLLLIGTLTGLLPRCCESVPAIPAIRLRRLLYIAALGLQSTLLGLGFAIRLDFWAMLGGVVVCYLLLNLYDHWLLTHLLRPAGAEQCFSEASNE